MTNLGADRMEEGAARFGRARSSCTRAARRGGKIAAAL